MHLLRAIGLAVCTCILLLAVGTLKATPTALPPLQAHSLPPTLAQWQDPTDSGDYFSEVKPTEVGYLVWWEFPIKVYFQASDRTEKAEKWVGAVLQAVREWNAYLPLELVSDRTAADITILRSAPPLKPIFDRNTGRFQLPRVRSAETRYEFYLKETANGKVIAAKFTIQMSPNQAPDYLLPSIRHEFGHALGIWGHSPLETDALYFSQVRNPPPISVRDINTLKRIYQQPTRLGWVVPEN